jgi:dUTP pyrophosphatase
MPSTRLLIERRHPAAKLPTKANPTDACYDLFLAEDLVVGAGTTAVADLGLAVELEEGWEMQIRGRSGLASRGIVAHPGTIDHLYRQNLKVIVHNLTASEARFEAGQRIAQMKLERVWEVELAEGLVASTMRGGLGSTGL